MSSEESSPMLGEKSRFHTHKSNGVYRAQSILKVLALGVFCVLLGISSSKLYYADRPAHAETSTDGYETLGTAHGKYGGQDETTQSNISSPSSTSALGTAMAPPPLLAKITIVTGGNNIIYERALRTHAAHNSLHGYRMHTLRQAILADVWSKPAYILSVILRELAKPAHKRLQWLFWVDADTIIINPHVPAEVFLPPAGWADDVHLIVAHDFNGLNNGVFPIRVHPWSVDLLTSVLSYPYYKPDDFLLFRDQSAMARLLETPKFARHTVRAPQRWFNAYQGEINETIAPFQTRPGDLLVHFAGVPNRDERMLYWLARAEEHHPEWEIDFEHTSYAAETREFWRAEKGRREAVAKTVAKLRHEMNARRDAVKRGMAQWGDALSDGERKRIDASVAAVYRAFDEDDTRYNVDVLKKAIARFREASRPLETRMDKSNKLLLKDAHALIFAAENMTVSLLPTPDTRAALKDLESAITRLKEEVMRGPISSAGPGSGPPMLDTSKVEAAMEDVSGRQADVQRKIEVARERTKGEEVHKMEELKHLHDGGGGQVETLEDDSPDDGGEGGTHAEDANGEVNGT